MFYQFISAGFSKTFQCFLEIEALNREFEEINLPKDIDMEDLFSLLNLRQSIEDLEREKWKISMKLKYVAPFLQPGRVLRVSCRFKIADKFLHFIHQICLLFPK